MRTIELQVDPLGLPALGIPYSWGSGHNWYVRLETGTYWFDTDGIKPAIPTPDHSPTMEDFRYAKTIRFTDYTDAK